MFNTRTLRTLALMLALCCATALTACLPEDKDPNKVAADANGSKETGGFYGTALGNAALAIQNAVVSDSSWFTNMTSGQELNLASMNITTQGLPAAVKSSVCPTGSGSEVYQITWIDGRDDAGKFSLKGIGSDPSTLLSALRTRVAAEQLGTYSGDGQMAMTNNSSKALPSTCSGLNIPKGAPVIVFDISRPAAPTTALARTEYKTVACGTVNNVKQTGTKVQKRTVTYNSDGTITPANATDGWTDAAMGSCINAVDVVITGGNTNKSAASALSGFADMTVANTLAAALKSQLDTMKCRDTTVQLNNGGTTAGGTQGNNSKTIDTCATTTVGGTAKAAAEATSSGGTDEKILSCTGTVPTSATTPYGGLTGTFTTSTGWSGTATLERKRTTSDVGGTLIATWIGKSNAVNCDATQRLDVGCQSLDQAPTLRARDPVNKYIAQTLAVDRTPVNYTGPDGRMDVQYIYSGSSMSLNAVEFRGWGWGQTFGCGAQIGFTGFFYMDCAYAGLMNVYYFNTDYLNATTANAANTGIQGSQISHSADWSDKTLFKPGITTVNPWSAPTVNCHWAKRDAVVKCSDYMTPTAGWNPAGPSGTPQASGTWDPRSVGMSLDNPMPKAITGSGQTYSTSRDSSDDEANTNAMVDTMTWMEKTVRDKYNSLTAAGNYVTEVVRPYQKYLNTCITTVCSTSYKNGAIRMGPGTDTQYLAAWRNGNTQITLLNTDGVAQDYAAKVTGNNISVGPTGNFAEPLYCGVGQVSAYSWPILHSWDETQSSQSCNGKGGCTTNYWTVHHDDWGSTTITDTMIQAWSSAAPAPGYSFPVHRYASPYGTWEGTNQSVIPNPIRY